MRRALVVAGICVLVAIAVVTVVGVRGGSTAPAPNHVAAGDAGVVRVAAVTRARRATPTLPQVPGGRSCFVTASPAGAAGGDQCGSARTCAEFISRSSSAPDRRHVLVLGSRCPAQAVLRGERAHPGLRTARSTAR